MAPRIFINLPVKDLEKSVAFFTRLGFSFDPHFMDEHATCMIIGEDIFVMLLTEEFFGTFTHKQIGDARQTTEVILTLSAGSREEVNHMISKAVEAGGYAPGKTEDHGWMYGRSFEDIDGHQWEIMYMDPHFPAEA